MSQVFEKLSSKDGKGRLLEEVVEALFSDLNFSNIRRQKSGSQYGFDVVGYKNNQCWKAECKNLKKEASLNDIAPKLIWHIQGQNIDRFLIVSVNGISNDLIYLLEQKVFSFPIEIWSGEYLNELITESPSALKLLEIENNGSYVKKNLSPLIFEPNNIKFEVHYSRSLPFSFDYFFLEQELIKAYTEFDFRLSARIANSTKQGIYIQEIKVKTLRYVPTGNQRILRLAKFKGNVEPLKLPFIPKTYSQGEVNLNEERILEVKSNSTELIEFTLSPKCNPGYYELIFEINYAHDGKYHSLISPIFQLHKKHTINNYLTLCVLGKYYDTAAHPILSLEENVWRNAKKEFPRHIKYLGPTQNDVTQNTYRSKTWTVNLLKWKQNKQEGKSSQTIKSTVQSKLLIDLKIPIEEMLFTKVDAIRQVLK